MHRSPLTPVFAGLRLGLHVLMVALTVVVVLRAILTDQPDAAVIVALGVLFGLVYALGGLRTRSTQWLRWWLAALSGIWIALMMLSPEAAYLVFGLFFLYLHLLPRLWGVLAVAVATAIAVVGFGLHGGWSVAGVIGPVIGAGVAVAIGLGYQALYREATERQRLIEQLTSTRVELAEQARAAGVLAERERLARDIHDTVAQGLASIQMLLHAAERSAPDHPGGERIRLARQAAADSLAETRQLIGDLTPAALDGQSLSEALTRICTQAQSGSLQTRFVVEGEPGRLPMPIEAALVRIAQGAVSNVVQHAQASRMAVTLGYDDDAVRLDIVDDGSGFDVSSISAGQTEGDPATSYGLTATRRRVELLDGTMSVESEPGLTAVAVEFALPSVPDADPRIDDPGAAAAGSQTDPDGPKGPNIPSARESRP